MKKWFFHFFLFGSLGVVSAARVLADGTWTPYLSADVYGGISKFGKDKVDGPSGSLVFIPAVRLGDAFFLLPSVTAGYRQARDVQELAGGGFLTQEQVSYSGSLKGVYVFSPGWKAKLHGFYKEEWIQETKDEKWGKGLFDHRKLGGGAEVERTGPRWKSVWLGTDYYITEFPNFESLSSQEGLGAEIKAGTHVLDFDSLDALAGGEVSLGEKAVFSGRVVISHRFFNDQKIVKKDGTYSSDDRRDLYAYNSWAYRYQLPPVTIFAVEVETLVGVDLVLTALDSNQNNYDVLRLKFNENYYDYGNVGGGPRMTFRFSEKLSLGLEYTLSGRSYKDRPGQDVSGLYKTKTISSQTQTFRFSLGYPLWRGLGVKALGAFQNARSNMDYETVYRYNYDSSSYFLGLTYRL